MSVFSGLNQPGMDADDGGGGAVTPPDTTGAIGPSHYVEMVNVAVAVYGRASLGLVSGPTSLDTFMASPSGTSMTDPQIIWDEQSQRWFYVGLAFEDTAGTVGNFLQYGFSRTSDPSDLDTGWCKYSLPSGTEPPGEGGPGDQNLLDDYPKLGDDDVHAVIGANVFNEDGDFLTSRVWSLPKPAAGAITSCPADPVATTFGSPGSPLTTADNDIAFTPVPTNTSDGSPIGYVVAADDPLETGSAEPRDQLMVWHVGGTGAAPTLVQDGNIGVTPYELPPPAFQPGPALLDTLDGRLTMAVADADPGVGGQKAIWTQHTVDPGDGTVVMRWYELLHASDTLRQEGTISDPVDDVFNGALSPAASGDLAVFNYNVSGLTQLPEIRARIRGPATAPGGTLADELTLGTSEAPASDFSCLSPFGCRWGDYAGASPDHSNPFVVWGSNQLIEAPGGPLATWATRNFAVGDQPPKASFSFSPSSPNTRDVVSFTSTSGDPDGGELDEAWDLDGDGSFDDATGQSASRRFATPGTHTVRLRVADPEGVADVAAQAIRVVLPPARAAQASGDFNGDGRFDRAVGVPGEDIGRDRDTGGVQVLFGAPGGLGGQGAQFLHQDLRGVPGAGEDGDRFGEALTAGDFNADGFDDLAVAAPREDVGRGTDAGAVTVFHGSSGGLVAAGSRLFAQGSAGIAGRSEDGDLLGRALAAGDFNGDGRDDLVAGAPGEGLGRRRSAGALLLLPGSGTGVAAAGNRLISQDSRGIQGRAERGDRFAGALTSSDFDGDGRADLAVGAPSEDLLGRSGAGAVHALFGSDGGLSGRDQLITQASPGVPGGVERGDGLGTTMAAGDLNGDGAGDLVVGVPGENLGRRVDAGALHVLTGSPGGLRTSGSRVFSQSSRGIAGVAERGDRFAAALATGDFDGDGREDLAAGAPGEDLARVDEAGAVHVLRGSGAGATANGSQLWSQRTRGVLGRAEAGDRFGFSLAGGDADGDGRVDLSIGVPGESIGRSRRAGGIAVLYGGPAGLGAERDQFFHQGSPGLAGRPEPGDRFGGG